ncbi:MAG: lamin tail domain-containing protein, partial [Bacteroidales bacterium]|nr:lamin tail domain-containing protein [Bacteroidales bacterium]
PQLPGNVMIVTVTKQDYYRYSATVDIIPPVGPYVVYNDHILNDPTGNNNGEADYGEDIELDMTLENLGSDPAYNVTATLICTDSYITLTDNYEVYGTINASSTSTINNAFAFSIADDIPDQHVLNFELQVDGNADDTWTSYFSIIVNAPNLEAGDMTIDDSSGGNGDGRLDPGETADIIIETTNTGHTDSPDAMGTLACSSPFITLISDSFDFGPIPTGSSENAVFTISVEGGTPTGTSVTFDYDVVADNYTASESYNAVVGQIPVLIVDLDGNNNSAPAMETALNNLSVPYEIYTSFPADLNLYKSIFLCLGIFSSNHVLSSTEGQNLSDYLNNGGLLYMEGGDTWAYDSQTTVHSMFNIDGQADGTSDMSTVAGQSGTFTTGMSFNYSGDNSWMDHLGAISPAILILENQSPVYGTGVAYDAGTYKTIGTSHEFGGLDDGTSPSTKDELMNLYLNFFGINGSLAYPAIDVTPSSMSATLPQDDSTTQILTISNTGDANLNWSLSVTGIPTSGIVINEIVTNSSDWAELYNGTGSIINLQDWTIYWTDTRGYTDLLTLPDFNFNPGTYIVLSEEPGTNTSTHIYLGSNFMWSASYGGSLSLFDDAGNGIDFVRWGGSTQTPPTGTSWIENTVLSTPNDSHSLGRDAASTDTDASDDWTVQAITEAAQNTPADFTALSGINSLKLNDPDLHSTNLYLEPVDFSFVDGPWLSANINSGTVLPGEFTEVIIKFNSTGLDIGTYNADLVINCNDPVNSVVTVPCILYVTDAGFDVNLTVFLEGPFDAGGMNTDLIALTDYPLSQPFNTTPWNYNGMETVGSIPNPNIVDWVLVELRDASSALNATQATIIATQAGFLLNNGTIVSLDGSSPMFFDQAVSSGLFAVIITRNHLAVLSASELTGGGSSYSYDFSTGVGQVYLGALSYSNLGDGKWGMASGDGNCDGEVTLSDEAPIWELQAGEAGYNLNDHNMDGQVDNTDKDEYLLPNIGKESQMPE